MRWVMLCGMAGLAACANGSDHALSDRQPGLNVADAALQAGAPGVALNVANGLLRQNPTNSAARLRAGEAEYQLGDLAAARACFNTVLAAQPGAFEAELGLGRIDLSIDPAAAQRRFQRLAASQPRDTAVLTDLGIAYDLIGQHQAAQKMYRAALDIAPTLQSARSNLALSVTLAGRAGAVPQNLVQPGGTSDAPTQLGANAVPGVSETPTAPDSQVSRYAGP